MCSALQIELPQKCSKRTSSLAIWFFTNSFICKMTFFFFLTRWNWCVTFSIKITKNMINLIISFYIGQISLKNYKVRLDNHILINIFCQTLCKWMHARQKTEPIILIFEQDDAFFLFVCNVVINYLYTNYNKRKLMYTKATGFPL